MPPQISQLLRQTLENKVLPASLRNQKELVQAWEETRGFYEKRAFQPVWSNLRGPRPQAKELIEAIPALGADGLDIRRYQPQRLSALVKEVQETKNFDDPEAQRRLADLDVELTYTYLSLAAHLARGRLQPKTIHAEWYTKPRSVDLDARLGQALAAEDAHQIVKILRSLTPPYVDYERLRQALVHYRALMAKGGWGAMSPGPDLRPGDRGPQVAALRARLAALGDLPATVKPPDPGTDVFDGDVAAAVSRFQRRHGLEITGKVDEETLAELNVPVQDRVRQLQVNMERWRWLPATLGDHYIVVNVPEFRLDVVEAEKTAMTMRVIVGKDQSRTPAFSDKMSYIEVNPYWNVPESIANAEILPKLAADPGYLASHNMEYVGEPPRLRQRPGGDNPLGKLKFMFPNDFNIYLHDTPAGHLFSKAERSFSHGCIRIEKPFELATYLLRGDPKWTPEALQAAIDSGENTTISLPRPLPVHILYWTAWADPDGTVEFRKDIYGHDAQLEQALAAEPPVWLDLNLVRKNVQAFTPPNPAAPGRPAPALPLPGRPSSSSPASQGG
ncbi:MAG TPA: L,D-transpeptidase family protein [Thermoanaerobaculia bacterium]|nr:L,D-transpeptidase family protein [Thermoanaerobaculia bacterium]